jgi:hypothetical protein
MAANTIQEYVAERGIAYLLHFTRLTNLGSILQHGLVRRGRLDGQNVTGVVNDQYRLDGTDAVSVSIGFPNYKMFYRYRQENPQEDWVVVVINPSALWELPCAFCVTNAAATRVSVIPIAQRRGLAAFQAMYGDFDDKIRGNLNLNDYLPTNPQAEVLMLDGVPLEYIRGVLVSNDTMKAQVEALYPDLKVWRNGDFFYPRHDYAHWQVQL